MIDHDAAKRVRKHTTVTNDFYHRDRRHTIVVSAKNFWTNQMTYLWNRMTEIVLRTPELRVILRGLSSPDSSGI